MATKNDVYIKLAEKLNAPASKRFLSICEAMFTPEEGKVLLELFAPATSKEVASRLKADEKSVSKTLDNMADRGLISKGKTQYCFHSNLTAFHHHTVGGVAREPVPQKVKDLWGDFFLNEWSDIIVDGYIRRKQATGRNVFSVWPAIGALELSPNIRPERILPEENFKLRIEKAKRRIVGKCGCRKNWAQCDHPIETCFAPFDNPGGIFYIDQPNRTSIREVSLEEALAVVHRNEQAGLVHAGACFCCTCSCEILYSLSKAKRFDLLDPSRFEATVDEELCIGCQDCVERCPFDAIEMRKVPGSKKLKASIISENCKGCGVCIVGCKQKALTYKEVRPPEFITSRQIRVGGIRGVGCLCTEVK